MYYSQSHTRGTPSEDPTHCCQNCFIRRLFLLSTKFYQFWHAHLKCYIVILNWSSKLLKLLEVSWRKWYKGWMYKGLVYHTDNNCFTIRDSNNYTHIYIYVCVCVCVCVCGVIVAVIGNGHGDQSSNPGWMCLFSYSANIIRKVMKPISLFLAMSKFKIIVTTVSWILTGCPARVTLYYAKLSGV